MASPPLLQFDELLEPIPGDEPAGDTVPFTTRQKLEDYRKEVNPADFAPDDPMRPTEVKRANWLGIIDLAKETLTGTSKDLLMAARLTEALTRQYGFAGTRDGLHLLRLLITNCWDRILPSIEDGDLEVRAGAFNWLDDPNRGARFPVSLRQVPMVFAGEEGYGWQHWKLMQDGRGGATPEHFDQALRDTPREQCQLCFDDLAEAMQQLDELGNVLTAKMEAVAPGMTSLRQAMVDCRMLADQILQRKGPPPAPVVVAPPAAATPGAPAGAATGAAVPAPALAPVRTRADAYRQLAEAAALLQEIEPHSPIPYLIQRAVALGNLPFPKLMRQLIRDANVLTEMNRELGILDEGGGAPAAPAGAGE